MTLSSALITAPNAAASAAPPGPLTLGVLALITITALIAGVTCWRARAAWLGAHDFRLPRRGTSALLLSAILVVLLVLVSTSQQRIPSLTIVSRNSPPHARIARPAPKRPGARVTAARQRCPRR